MYALMETTIFMSLPILHYSPINIFYFIFYILPALMTGLGPEWV